MLSPSLYFPSHSKASEKLPDIWLCTLIYNIRKGCSLCAKHWSSKFEVPKQWWMPLNKKTLEGYRQHTATLMFPTWPPNHWSPATPGTIFCLLCLYPENMMTMINLRLIDFLIPILLHQEPPIISSTTGPVQWPCLLSSPLCRTLCGVVFCPTRTTWLPRDQTESLPSGCRCPR